MAVQGPLLSDPTKQCMCRSLQASNKSLHDNHKSVGLQSSVADYDTLERVLELDQKLSNLITAMMNCSTCSANPLCTMALLRELDLLCTLYVTEQAKCATKLDHPGCGDLNDDCAKVDSSTLRIGRFVLDSGERKVVGRVMVKQGLDHIQKNLQKVQAEQKRSDSGAMQDEITSQVQGILSKVWEASAYEFL